MSLIEMPPDWEPSDFALFRQQHPQVIEWFWDRLGDLEGGDGAALSSEFWVDEEGS